ncbi:MAG TPA: replication factor C small subunit [Candidatus Nanoarchaeia archaeon]|nr:replication factor C small subunit [Candidatus Nanoarchaeia archaeon]
MSYSPSSIWTEKYRPSDFSEIKGQKDIVEKIEAFVKSRNMPHLLFSGPAGVGKTTLSLVIAKRLFGENWRQNTLELNASDERGIDVVRVKVKDFARTKALGEVPFKLIYLDESDALTKDAQQALRRTMENYTKTCRFILSCNYSSKIIDPIQSRCAVFRFKPLSKEEIFEVIEKIVREEKNQNGEVQPALMLEVKEALYEVSNGDVRRLTNIMQSCFAIKKLGEDLTVENVYSMASVAKPKEVNEILSLAAKGNFLESRKKLLNLMLDYGLSGLDIIKQIQKEIWNLDLIDAKKVGLVDKCGEIEFRMVEGSDEYVQLESFLAFVMMIGGK